MCGKDMEAAGWFCGTCHFYLLSSRTKGAVVMAAPSNESRTGNEIRYKLVTRRLPLHARSQWPRKEFILLPINTKVQRNLVCQDKSIISGNSSAVPRNIWPPSDAFIAHRVPKSGDRDVSISFTRAGEATVGGSYCSLRRPRSFQFIYHAPGIRCARPIVLPLRRSGDTCFQSINYA